jgi:LysM repeat protein
MKIELEVLTKSACVCILGPEIMLSRCELVLFVTRSGAMGTSKTRGGASVASGGGEPVETVAALRKDIDDLSARMQKLHKEVEILKLQSSSLSENQGNQVKKIAAEEFGRYDVVDTVDKKINTLSREFSQKINALCEKFSHAFNAAAGAIDGQRKVLAMTGMGVKQSEGLFHRVKVGETLDSIAVKFKTTKDEILKFNFVVDEDHLSVGLMLFIPWVPHDFPEE